MCLSLHSHFDLNRTALTATCWSERKLRNSIDIPCTCFKIILTDLEVRNWSKGVSIPIFVLDMHFLFCLLCFVLYRLKYNVVPFIFKLYQYFVTRNSRNTKGRFTHSMPCSCRARAVPLSRRAVKGLECVFPICFTQCGRVWFTLAMPCPCHVLTMPFFSRPRHITAVFRRPCCAVALRRTAWSEHGMGVAWKWHGKCEWDTAALCKSNGKNTF